MPIWDEGWNSKPGRKKKRHTLLKAHILHLWASTCLISLKNIIVILNVHLSWKMWLQHNITWSSKSIQTIIVTIRIDHSFLFIFLTKYKLEIINCLSNFIYFETLILCLFLYSKLSSFDYFNKLGNCKVSLYTCRSRDLDRNKSLFYYE